MLRYIGMFIAVCAFVRTIDPIAIAEKTVIINKVKKENNFVDYLESKGFKFPVVVTAQMLHETDKLSSNIYEQCNNLFGMKRNSRRWNCGVCRGHAKYKTKQESLNDYLEWQRKYLPYYEKKTGKKIETNEDYYKFLSWIGYAEDPFYIKKLSPYVKELEYYSS